MSNQENEILWRHFELHIDLYKHYLNVVIQFNLFFYAITGGILSFFFSQPHKEVIRFALILPMVMSLLFVCISIFGAIQNRNVDMEVRRITDLLNLPVYPDIRVLTFTLFICAIFFTLIFIGLLLVFIYAQTFPTVPVK